MKLVNLTLVNLTPHPLRLISGGVETVLDPSGVVARVLPGVASVLLATEGFPVPIYTREILGSVSGLPEPAPGVLYVVSLAVATALAGSRKDVLRPGTGPNDDPVRDEKGHIVGVTRLIMA